MAERLGVFHADAHGKNVSLVWGEQGEAALAPFYDLVCTRIYPGIDRSLAMHIGGQRDPGLVGRRDWERLARAVGVGPRVVVAEVERQAGALPAAFDGVAAALRAAHGDSPAIERVQRVVRTQCRRSLAILRRG